MTQVRYCPPAATLHLYSFAAVGIYSHRTAYTSCYYLTPRLTLVSAYIFPVSSPDSGLCFGRRQHPHTRTCYEFSSLSTYRSRSSQIIGFVSHLLLLSPPMSLISNSWAQHFCHLWSWLSTAVQCKCAIILSGDVVLFYCYLRMAPM